jgi:hypothetical protein
MKFLLPVFFCLALRVSSPADEAKESSRAGADNLIGYAQTSEAALMGILYDLKQTEARTPTVMNTYDYDRTISQFIMKGWDESVLNKFHQISHPFYTTQIFIPMLGNQIAPKAFGVADRLKDGFWVIHYKGQVVPPMDGRYRFAGYAHATMLVAINGRLVLNGCRYNINKVQKDFPLQSTQTAADPQAGAPAGDFRLTIGPWVDFKHAEPVDIDILFGNRHVSELCAFLLMEKEGETYPTDPLTHYPILPLFQVAWYDGDLQQDKFSTRCQANAMIWKCLQ